MGCGEVRPADETLVLDMSVEQMRWGWGKKVWKRPLHSLVGREPGVNPTPLLYPFNAPWTLRRLGFHTRPDGSPRLETSAPAPGPEGPGARPLLCFFLSLRFTSTPPVSPPFLQPVSTHVRTP